MTKNEAIDMSIDLVVPLMKAQAHSGAEKRDRLMSRIG